MAIKLSNVIGAPFIPEVLQQLAIRSGRNSSVSRTPDEVMFLANKTAWVRLTSSVNVSLPPITVTSDPLYNIGATVAAETFYRKLELSYTDYPKPDSLAKRWILEAGTSIQSGNSITLRQGIGPDGAYGLGGTQELGYRPMPGLTSVQVDTVGRLGSLRQATISFKVWNMNQLNIIEALYFRLGYSMLLEWGHTQYFKNDGEFIQKEIYGIQDPFAGNRRKEAIQQEIKKKALETSGNYDGMLGVVSNFNWSFNQSGGYDCTVRLIGLGAIMDSLRIDQTYTLPEGAIKEFKKNQDLIAQLIEQNRKLTEELKNAKTPSTPQQGFYPPTPTSVASLYRLEQLFDNFKGDFENDYFNTYTIYNFNNFTGGINTGGVSYFGTFDNAASDIDRKEATDRYGGLWIKYTSGLTNIRQGNIVSLNTSLLNNYIQNNKPRAGTLFTANVNGLNGSTNISKFFDSYTSVYFETQTSARGGTTFTPIPVGLNSRLYDGAFYDQAFINLSNNYPFKGDRTYPVSFVYGVNAASKEEFYPITRNLLIKALDQWQAAGSQAVISNISFSKESFTVEIEGTFVTPIEVPVSTAAVNASNLTSEAKNNILTNKPSIQLNVTWKFSFNNPLFIGNKLADSQEQFAQKQQAQQANDGNTDGAVNQSDTGQVDAAKGFQSALHAMLTVIKAQVQSNAKIINKKVAAVDIKQNTKLFYDSGILSKIFKTETKGNSEVLSIPKTPVAGPDGLPFDITGYALKGFNSDLMLSPELYNEVPPLSNEPSIFENLCKAFIIRYPEAGADGEGNKIQVPVYIPFGYLLAFLNNMCLIYDAVQKQNSTESSNGIEKRPYVYIDFNPETNFCLTSPQQFSIDPYVCMIPLQATSEQYKSIFPENITTIEGGFFDPQSADNEVSSVLSKEGMQFQTPGIPYQGKIMNILLNIDYLLGIAEQYQGSDPEHAVYLQQFLERILVDVNKSLGNINSLKVSYRDDSNTIQIQDSQWAPNLPGKEESAIVLNSRILNNELPVFESGSLAREFQLKTVISTKLASTIAISAQAATGSVNSTDHSSFSWLNQNYQDRYMPYKQDPGNGSSGTSIDGQSKKDSNAVKAAKQFNDHVKNLYSKDILSVKETLEMAKNYYIERMSKVKSADPVTVAAPFIPADLEITMDGISNIIMFNAFLVPENRLPLSLRGVNGTPKVGFVVTGLTHTIENNQWLTKLKGQMIKLRNFTGSGVTAQLTAPPPSRTTAATASRSLPGVGTGCSRAASNAIRNAGPGFELLKKTLANNGLNSTIALASILAIIGGESNWDGGREEDFRYTQARLIQVFPDLTPNQIQRALAAKSRREFFSIVYGEYNPQRIGNRNVQDGGLYYGRGYIQLTGYANYKRYGDLIGRDLVNNPNLAADPTIAAQIVVAYIKDRVKANINSSDYFQTAVYAVGTPVDREVKVGYYNCLLGQV